MAPLAILKYNLPDEEDEFQGAVNSINYYTTLWDLNQYLEGIEKYGSKEMSKLKYQEVVEKIREQLLTFMNENNVKFK